MDAEFARVFERRLGPAPDLTVLENSLIQYALYSVLVVLSATIQQQEHRR
jgi:hypothetical protein